MDDTFMTIIEADDQLLGTKTYFPTKYQLELWLSARFGNANNQVRVPYRHGFERNMIKIRGLVLPKEEILDRNLLPDWTETKKYQKVKFAKQLEKTKQLLAKAALRNAEKGMALRFAGQNFMQTMGSFGEVSDALMNPRGLGVRLRDAVFMDDLADGKAMAKALVAKGANVNVKDEKGWTALHVCAWKDNSHVADVLLRSGRCNVNEQTNNGNTALHWAAQKDHRSMAEMLLLQKSIDVDSQNVLGQTPLHICACYGSLAVAKVLLRCKASMEIKSDEMDTPVDIARRCKQQAVYDHFILLQREEREAELELQRRQDQQAGVTGGGVGGSKRTYIYTSSHPKASPFLQRGSDSPPSTGGAVAGARRSVSAHEPMESVQNRQRGNVAGRRRGSKISSAGFEAISSRAQPPPKAVSVIRRVRHGYRQPVRAESVEEDPSTFHKSGFESSDDEEEEDEGSDHLQQQQGQGLGQQYHHAGQSRGGGRAIEDFWSTTFPPSR